MTPKIHEAVLNATVDASVLNRYFVDPVYVDMLVRNNVIPCKVKEFVEIEGTYLAPIVEYIKLAQWDEEGRMLQSTIQDAIGNNVTETYDYAEEDIITGYQYMADKVIVSKYRLEDGLTLSQKLVENDEVIEVFNITELNEDGTIAKITESMLEFGQDGDSIVNMGSKVQDYTYENGLMVTEDIFENENRTNWFRHERDANSNIIKTFMPNGEGGELIADYIYDAKNNMVEQHMEGSLVARVANAYDESERLLTISHFVKKVIPTVDENGDTVEAVQEDEVVTLDLAKYWSVKVAA